MNIKLTNKLRVAFKSHAGSKLLKGQPHVVARCLGRAYPELMKERLSEVLDIIFMLQKAEEGNRP